MTKDVWADPPEQRLARPSRVRPPRGPARERGLARAGPSPTTALMPRASRAESSSRLSRTPQPHQADGRCVTPPAVPRPRRIGETLNAYLEPGPPLPAPDPAGARPPAAARVRAPLRAPLNPSSGRSPALSGPQPWPRESPRGSRSAGTRTASGRSTTGAGTSPGNGVRRRAGI